MLDAMLSEGIMTIVHVATCATTLTSLCLKT